MKKNIFLFLIVFAIAKINAQNYQISFAGTGASTTVDSVKVIDLSNCHRPTLSGNSTLILSGATGLEKQILFVDLFNKYLSQSSNKLLFHKFFQSNLWEVQYKSI